jgi:ATP phosphoribosyltransferase regulatory subunit
VLHTRPEGLNATREPLQFGAETYGHAGLEADLEIQDLALDCLRSAGITQITLDLGDARILRGLLAGITVPPTQEAALMEALAAKDASSVQELTTAFPAAVRQGLRALMRLYGGDDVLAAAQRELPAHALITAALADLQSLSRRVQLAHPEVHVGFDLADLGGYGYYSGARFSIYTDGCSDAIARGGRYDEVGAVFGRNRPAVGFSLDLKELASLVPPCRMGAAIRAPWGESDALRSAVRRLREQGETVVCILPGHEHEGQEFDCDRELVCAGDQWVVRAL